MKPNVNGMTTWLLEYVVALFFFETLMHDFKWSGGDSSPARKAPHYSLHIVV